MSCRRPHVRGHPPRVALRDIVTRRDVGPAQGRIGFDFDPDLLDGRVWSQSGEPASFLGFSLGECGGGIGADEAAKLHGTGDADFEGAAAEQALVDDAFADLARPTAIADY